MTSPPRRAQKGQYAFSFPLKPGETQFQVSYHMPYTGEASFSPKPLADVQHFVVMTAEGMTFAPKNAQRFQSMPDTGPGMMVATKAKPGEDLGFKLTGTGQFRRRRSKPRAAVRGRWRRSHGGGQAAARDNRPGGGLGAPIDSDDPLHDYRAVILGVFAVVLVMGGAFRDFESRTSPGSRGRSRRGDVRRTPKAAETPASATAMPRYWRR